MASQARVGGAGQRPQLSGTFSHLLHLGSQYLLVTKLHKNPDLLPPSSRHDDVSNPRLGSQESDHPRYPKEEKEQPPKGSAQSIMPPHSNESLLCPPPPCPPALGVLGKGKVHDCFPDNGRRGCVLESQQVPALPLAPSGDSWQLTSLLLARVSPH